MRTSVKHRKKSERYSMCVFVCECASCCASIFSLQGVFMNTSPLWNVIYIFPLERMLMRAWAVKTFCQRLHLFPTLDGCVSKHSFILFSAWHMHMHVFSLTDLFWVHYFSFFFYEVINIVIENNFLMQE